MKRNIIVCKTEASTLLRTIARISMNMCSSNGTPDSTGFVGSDRIFLCKKCNQHWRSDDNPYATTRRASLHTLHHGSLQIEVQDNQCKCGSIVRYNGLTNGLFAATKSHVFTRELLNVSVFDVCSIELTFREAFMPWKKKAC